MGGRGRLIWMGKEIGLHTSPKEDDDVLTLTSTFLGMSGKLISQKSLIDPVYFMTVLKFFKKAL